MGQSVPLTLSRSIEESNDLKYHAFAALHRIRYSSKPALLILHSALVNP